MKAMIASGVVSGRQDIAERMGETIDEAARKLARGKRLTGQDGRHLRIVAIWLGIELEEVIDTDGTECPPSVPPPGLTRAA